LAPDRLRLTGQIQKPDTDLKLLAAAGDRSIDDIVQLRVFVLLTRRSAPPQRRGVDDVEPAKSGQPRRDFVDQGKPQAFLVLAIDFSEREDADPKPMTTGAGPVNVHGAVKAGRSMGRPRQPCLRPLRPYALVELLRLGQWLNASRNPQCFPAPLIFAQGLVSLAPFGKRPHQGVPCVLMRRIE